MKINLYKIKHTRKRSRETKLYKKITNLAEYTEIHTHITKK